MTRSHLRFTLPMLVCLSTYTGPCAAEAWPPPTEMSERQSKRDSDFVPIRVTGVYGISYLGFNVVIPDEALAYGPSCDAHGICGSTHGFSGTLVGDSEAILYLFAAYPTFRSIQPHAVPSIQEAVEHVLKVERSSRTAFVVRESELQLDGLLARRVVARVRHLPKVSPRMLDFIVAVRPLPESDSIVYELRLNTLEAHYPAQKRVLDATLRSFRLVPIVP